MKCEKCKKNDACYHSTTIINGVSNTVNLCEDCAVKEGLLNNKPESFFEDFFDTFTDFLPFSFDKDFACPSCNTSLSDFLSDGIFGCDDCFKTFKNMTNKVIQELHPKTVQDEKIEFRTPSSNKSKEEQKIDDLKDELQKAIDEERYEDAGKINKELKALLSAQNKKENNEK